MKKIALFILLLFTLNACEKATYVDYFIDNQSTEVISVKGSNIIHNSDIDFSIKPGIVKNISGWSKRGKTIDFFEPVSMFGDDLIIINANGDTLIKEYQLQSNWIAEIDEKRGEARHKYVLIILDSDF
jgi:hypothetical protein